VRRLTLVLVVLALLRAASARAEEPVIVALGDSLTAGLGVAAEEAYPALLQARLAREGLHYRVVNAGVSGDTTAGARRRVDWVLRARPAIVVVALGANDGLRGLPVEEIRANLQRILKACRDAGAKLVVIGIELPVNYGPQYRDGLRNMYRDIAREFNAPLVPFLLEGVATDPKLMQDDGLHPLAAAEPRVLETVWPVLEPVLESLR